jgi:hypothetical protein
MRTIQEIWYEYHDNPVNAWNCDPVNNMHPYPPFLRFRARGIILEIGVEKGISTASFLLGLEKNGGHLYSVDVLDFSDILSHPQWTFIHSDSRNIGKVMSIVPQPIDILFVDGCHVHPGVDTDLYGYAPFVRKGGMILIHDIYTPFDVTPERRLGWGTEDVAEAYHRFCFDTGYTHFELPGQFGMGVIYKG